jgi:hypothetical protein
VTPVPFSHCPLYPPLQHCSDSTLLCPIPTDILNRLTVRLLETRASTLTTELLGLAAAVVGNEEGSVELDESLLEEVLGVLIDELLVVGDQGLGDGLSDGVDLGNVSTTANSHTDINIGELVKANNEERLVDLEAEDLRLDKLERSSIDLDETTAGLAVGNGGGRLLLAKTLYGLGSTHFCGCRVLSRSRRV